jgi:hypothetical protein
MLWLCSGYALVMLWLPCGYLLSGRSPYWSIERSSRRWGAEPPERSSRRWGAEPPERSSRRWGADPPPPLGGGTPLDQLKLESSIYCEDVESDT